MGHMAGIDRNQMVVRCLDEMVSADSPVRQINRLIDALDT